VGSDKDGEVGIGNSIGVDRACGIVADRGALTDVRLGT